MKSDSSDTRRYRQTARARAAEETADRILAAFVERLRKGWFDEIRLEDVASEAGVTVQTVIRRFGGKEGLLDASHQRLRTEILAGRDLPEGDVSQALDAIIREYETQGEFVMRVLAQEDRYPEIKEMADRGREVHREWVGKVFAPWLDRLRGDRRRHAHDRLVIALDIYIWKLVRVDMKRSKASLQRTMLEMCAAALGVTPDKLANAPAPENDNA